MHGRRPSRIQDNPSAAGSGSSEPEIGNVIRVKSEKAVRVSPEPACPAVVIPGLALVLSDLPLAFIQPLLLRRVDDRVKSRPARHWVLAKLHPSAPERRLGRFEFGFPELTAFRVIVASPLARSGQHLAAVTELELIPETHDNQCARTRIRAQGNLRRGANMSAPR
jgi:hypothetical protein